MYMYTDLVQCVQLILINYLLTTLNTAWTNFLVTCTCTRQERGPLVFASERFVLGRSKIDRKPPVPEMPLVNCYDVEEKRNRVLYPWKI